MNCQWVGDGSNSTEWPAVSGASGVWWSEAPSLLSDAAESFPHLSHDLVDLKRLQEVRLLGELCPPVPQAFLLARFLRFVIGLHDHLLDGDFPVFYSHGLFLGLFLSSVRQSSCSQPITLRGTLHNMAKLFIHDSGSLHEQISEHLSQINIGQPLVSAVQAIGDSFVIDAGRDNLRQVVVPRLEEVGIAADAYDKIFGAPRQTRVPSPRTLCPLRFYLPQGHIPPGGRMAGSESCML